MTLAVHHLGSHPRSRIPMLIESHRHTRDDLVLWKEHWAADLAVDLGGRVGAALQAIDGFLSRGSAYAGCSWGKDSLVVAHLLWQHARSVPLMHLRPTNHNPDCDAVRDAYFASFPGQQYEEIVVDYSGIDRLLLTDDEVDKATDDRWYAAIKAYCDQCGERRILGIRGDESGGRRIRMRRWGVESKSALAPIGFWKESHVFGYLAQNDLPVHPAYAMLGGGRWPRTHLRVAEIGDTRGCLRGRREWEIEYYGDVLRKIESTSRTQQK